MEVFVKSFSTYRTVKQATVISSAYVLDSLDMETSTVTVNGTGINRADTGNWLITEEGIYQISNVKPQSDRTLLTLVSPLDAFSRPLELEAQGSDQTVGGFILGQLQTHWTDCDDTVYAMPYLQIVNTDTTGYVAPETDQSGCYDLPSYCRLMRKTYRIAVRFADAGDHLHCSIEKTGIVARQIPFDDGQSFLQNVNYSSSGMAKLTAIQDIDTGEKDEEGNAILVKERTTWYLSESGEVSQLIPSRRASGEWGSIYIKGNNKDVETEVLKAFAKNKSNHKLEFWSDRDLAVQTDCTFMVYGELLKSYISYKRKVSEDRRYYYKSGELATTATEKLRGALK